MKSRSRPAGFRRSLSRLAAAFLAPLLFFSVSSRASQDEEGFVPLFNGRDLTGWIGDPRLWKVENGVIVGSTEEVQIKRNSFLSTTRSFSDFTLRVSVKLIRGNSGIQFRSEQHPDYAVKGYQADIADEKYFGMLYDEGKRGMMDYDDARKIFDQVAREKNRLGPLYPIKLHQMGEPSIHPRLVDIVRYAEQEKGLPIELNTNCSLLTEELVDGLYDAGLTSFILSYQTPDEESFETRKAKNKKLTFDIYLEKVRMAVERKIAKGASTKLEIDIMNTLGSPEIRIVGSNSQADRVMLDWISFARSIERKFGLPPKRHDINFVDGGFRFLEHDADTGRYEILPGVDILWKELHTWGNIIQGEAVKQKVDGYCPAPNEQFVILWDGTVTVCCTDYEGTLNMGNVHEQSIEEIWTGEKWRRLRTTMWEDVLESKTCRVCKGVEEPDLVQIQL